MTSQFQNYVPIQGLLVGAAPGINPTESLLESVDVDTQGDANTTETMSESVVVTVT